MMSVGDENISDVILEKAGRYRRRFSNEMASIKLNIIHSVFRYCARFARNEF